jgi:hypothetical protein
MLDVIQLSTQNGLESYENLLNRFEEIEPYFLPKYMELFSDGLNNLICFSFVGQSSDAFILMPGYLKPVIIDGLETEYFDFITPYGYTGPIFSKNISNSEICQFWKEIDFWHKENFVVTEFIRFNLWDNYYFYNSEILPTMLNVKGKILTEEDQWSSFEYKVRKNVKRALRENLTSRIYYNDIPDNIISEFHEIYISTMQRTNAKETFMYSIDKFQEFIKTNSSYTAIITIYHETMPVSSELVLVSRDSIYSFLGGTKEVYFDKRPNDYLKYEAINWARNNNKKYYVLGGGYGFEDGIFKYKRAFFPNDCVSYFTGRKVINYKKYMDLVNRYNNARVKHGLNVIEHGTSAFFPLYNLPMY